MKFLTSTIGLECNGHGRVGKLVHVEVSEDNLGRIHLQAVSARNLSEIPGHFVLSRNLYEDTIRAEKTDLAIDLLKLVGWVPTALDR